jgi:hypothetical protein
LPPWFVDELGAIVVIVMGVPEGGGGAGFGDGAGSPLDDEQPLQPTAAARRMAEVARGSIPSF